MAEPDADLVERILDGDQRACQALAQRFTGPVLNVILRLVRDRGVAEELAQDAFVKVFRGLNTFDPAYPLTPWVLRIAHNTAIDYLRRQRPDQVPLAEDADAGPRAVLADERERSPFAQAELAGLREALDWALQQLRPVHRELIVLRYQEDQSYEEIARIVGMPVGTVKSHLHRARQAMARLLAESGWAPATGGDRVQPSTGQDT